MNKILKRIGWALFTVFVWPFYFLYLMFIAPFQLPKQIDEPPPYEPRWDFTIYPEIEYEVRFKEDYDGR